MPFVAFGGELQGVSLSRLVQRTVVSRACALGDKQIQHQGYEHHICPTRGSTSVLLVRAVCMFLRSLEHHAP